MTIIYRGIASTKVSVYDDLRFVAPLTHHVKHSPDGFAWGYYGSGPAELARCLLIDALDIKRHHDALGGDCEGCWWCDNGWEIEPEMYQRFKFDVIANLKSEKSWKLTRNEIVAWTDHYLSMKENRDDN